MFTESVADSRPALLRRKNIVVVESSVPGRSGKRIVISTFGSLGDLHPYIALALGLQARGHRAVIATSGFYRAKVESLGIGFAPVRPDKPNTDADPDLMRRIMDQRQGTETVIGELLMPVLRQSYDDTLAAAEGADLLVSHPLTYTTPLVAEKQGIPWASTLLQPIGFLSVYDPPVLPPAPYLAKFRFLGPTFHRLLFGIGKWSCRSWTVPWHRLRAEIGLPPTSHSPLFEGQHSPSLVLAMFSPLFASKQRDWPAQTVVSGFPFYDQDGEAGLSSELQNFLDAGPPPIVFTLGSSAVMDAGPFYERSTAAAQLLGRRAVLLVGKDTNNRPASLPESVIAVDYAPFSALFPRTAAIVHQGGVGTTAQAMHAGRPMLVMPFGHDQPDNAERLKRLGISRTLPRRRYTSTRAAAELQLLLHQPTYAERAAAVGKQVGQEDGVRTACDALEALLGSLDRKAT
jgi:rhamnosyltransferase subunit B